MVSTSAGYNPLETVRSVGMRIKVAASSGEKVFTSQDIIFAEIFEGVDMACDKFLSRTIDFEAVDCFGFSSPLTASELTGKKVKAEVRIGQEYIGVGEFFIDRVYTENSGLTVRINAADAVRKMSRYITGLAVSSPTTLSNLINYGNGAVYGYTFYVDTISQNALVYPTMYSEVDTQRRCLLFLAQAALSSQIWTDRLGNVHIENLTSRTGYNKTITADEILEYSQSSLRSYTDCVEVSGENNGGKVSGTNGSYFSGCNMKIMKNDFLASSSASAVAENYRKARNLRYELKLKTRCDPSVEVGDRVNVMNRDNRMIGEFTVASQNIHFSRMGLSADITAVAPAPMN